MNKKAYDFFSKILDSLTEQIAVINKTGSIVYVNKSWIDFCEMNSGTVDRNKWVDINYLEVSDSASMTGESYALEASKGIRSVINGDNEVFFLEYPCHSPDEQRWFMMKVTSFESDNDNYYVLSHQNITQRRVAEDELSRKFVDLKKAQTAMKAQSRQAAMGEMLSTIAHQWRQPLSSISSIAMKMRLTYELGSIDFETKEGVEKAKKYFSENIEGIEDLVQYLSQTIDDFRSFDKSNMKLTRISLDEIVIKTLRILKEALKNSGIKIIEEYNSEEAIEVYQNELMQVIINILQNAHDILSTGKIKKPYIRITTEKKGIVICNNGDRIPEEIMGKIFEPYFSTKNEKNGTGLGLYMSKVIIKEHHKGKIAAINTDEGVCFKIKL